MSSSDFIFSNSKSTAHSIPLSVKDLLLCFSMLSDVYFSLILHEGYHKLFGNSFIVYHRTKSVINPSLNSSWRFLFNLFLFWRTRWSYLFWDNCCCLPLILFGKPVSLILIQPFFFPYYKKQKKCVNRFFFLFGCFHLCDCCLNLK